MELVDVTDSKSVDGDIVWVRVPPPAPKAAVPFGGGCFCVIEWDSKARPERSEGAKQSSELFCRAWESPTTGIATPAGESHHRESLSCSPHAKLKEFSSASGTRKAIIKQSGGLFYRPWESPTTGITSQSTNATKPPIRSGFVVSDEHFKGDQSLKNVMTSCAIRSGQSTMGE